MISFKPFFETLLKKNVTEYHLIFKQGIHSNTIYRMKRNMPITTRTLDTLCFVLDCDVTDILEYIKDEE